MRHREAIREAKRRGKERGLAQASWQFNGNTNKATYRAFLDAYDGGGDTDPWDHPAWLSGEFAGESVEELVGDLFVGRFKGVFDAEVRMDEVCTAYEQAAEDAYWLELVHVAKLQLQED